MGEMVAHRETEDTSMGELAELMVGRPLQSVNHLRAETLPADTEFGIEVRGLRLVDEDGTVRLKNLDLSVRRGEILGVAGVAGNGQSELLEVLAGIRAPTAGDFVINGREATATTLPDPSSMRALRVNHVPEDRLKLGLIKAFSAAESSVLGYHRAERISWRGLLRLSTIRRICTELMERFDVRPPAPRQPAAGFSGGNQQKLVLAREIETQPSIMLIGQPTRGVDIGGIAFIHAEIMARKAAGCAILLVSVELDEILALSDRIAVMNAGRIVGRMPRAEADVGRIGLMMAGVSETGAAA